jgi:hypothetical protein
MASATGRPEAPQAPAESDERVQQTRSEPIDAAAPEAKPASRSWRWVEAAALPVLFVALGAVFAITEPGSFLTVGNAASVLGTNTVLVGVMAAALVP